MSQVIKGSVTEAIVYTDIIEESAKKQIHDLCDSEAARNSVIRIMPDVHAGAGCTIGTTMTIKDRVVPNLVGVDIGCGMYTVKLAQKRVNWNKLDEACHKVPSGMNVWEEPIEKFDISKLRCYDKLQNIERLERSLGTLGGGNHFIELDRGDNETLYLVIHSGSRNLGKQVADIYQRMAIERINGSKAEMMEKRKALVDQYKAEGREKDISKALKGLNQKLGAASNVPNDLCWLEGESMADYIHDMEICQQWAKRNRELIAKTILDYAKLQAAHSFHTIHNYIDTENMIVRKGAISAKKGEMLLIPINMRDGSILGAGKGNPDWNWSAPHGAGRVMSQTEAREKITMEEYVKSMENVLSTSVNEETIDEAPMAYKTLNDILGAIGDTVSVFTLLKPAYNFKAGQE